MKNLFVSNETGEGLHSLQLEKVLKIIKESAGMKITQRTTPLLYQSKGFIGLVKSDLGDVDVTDLDDVDVTKYKDGLSAALLANEEQKAEDAKRKKDCPGGRNKSARTKTRSSPSGPSSTSTASSTSTTTSTTSSTSTSTSTSADENVAPKANVAKDKQSPPPNLWCRGKSWWCRGGVAEEGWREREREEPPLHGLEKWLLNKWGKTVP